MIEYRCVYYICLAHNNTCCPGLGRLTRFILEVIEALASLYHLGNVLLHHVDDLIDLRLHPGVTSGNNRHESQEMNGIICWGVITSLFSETPDIPISPSLVFNSVQLASGKKAFKGFYYFGVIPVPLLRTDVRSMRGHWRGNQKWLRLLSRVVCFLHQRVRFSISNTLIVPHQAWT